MELPLKTAAAENSASLDREAERRKSEDIRGRHGLKDMMEQFVAYLQSRSVGEGAKSIFQRFKKVIHYAIDHDVMLKDPCKGATCKVDGQILRKDVLSPEEIQRLIACHYDNENPNVRRAFIFCLYCGLRFCDVKDLTYKNIDYANKLLKFEQNKTKGHSAQ